MLLRLAAVVDELDNAWAKLGRANLHAETLKNEVRAFEADPQAITTGRKFDPQVRAIVVYVAKIKTVPAHWPLVLGDALHDFRCVLDHVTWQFAVRHLGGEHTDKRVIREIQFPLVFNPSKWAGQSVLSHISADHARLIEQFQPYHTRDANKVHPFGALRTLNNRDKHQQIPLVFLLGNAATITNIPNRLYYDCMPTGNAELLPVPDGVLREGTNLIRYFVRPSPIGPNPDMEVDVKPTGYVAVEERLPVVDVLDALNKWCRALLSEAGTLLRA